MKIFFLLFAAFLFAVNIAYSAPVADSCLWMKNSNEFPYSNPDSVKIDSCRDSPTFNKFFAKKGYTIQFQPYFYPFSRVLEVQEKVGVSEIDSLHLVLKNRLLALQDTVGLIFFYGGSNSIPDSDEIGNPVFRISFERYQNIDYIVEHLRSTVDSIRKVSEPMSPRKYLGDIEFSEENNSITVYPNPVTDFIMIDKSSNISNIDIIEIFSLEGKKIFDCTYTETLDVSFLQSGVYILKINNSSIKFIKE